MKVRGDKNSVTVNSVKGGDGSTNSMTVGPETQTIRSWWKKDWVFGWAAVLASLAGIGVTILLALAVQK